MLEGLSLKLRYAKYDGERYLNRSKTRCISGEKNKSIGQRFRFDYQFRSPSIPLTTPINQLTALKKKRKKRKKGEQKLVSPRQKSHPGLRSAIDYRFTGRWASRHSSKSRWIDRAIERSANGLPPRKILRLSRWSAFAARKRGEVTGVVAPTIPGLRHTQGGTARPVRNATLEIFSVVCYSPCSPFIGPIYRSDR